MLPPFIIDQIRKREEETRRDDPPVVELPLYAPQHPLRPRREVEGRREEEESDRGVVIIDL